MLAWQARYGFLQLHQRRRYRIVADERLLADQHLVQHDPEAIQVRTPIEFRADRLFGAHVLRRADGQARLGQLGAVVHRFGDAEIGQNRRAIIAEQHVSGFDIAVNKALVVSVAKRSGDVLGDGDRVTDAIRRTDALFERAAVAVLHRHVIEIVGGATDVVDRHDVFVTQFGDDFAFLEKAIAERLV